ncbi:hypothetical protein GCM10023201_10100 [Actinomycetospora corticicola]|uniref:ABC-2 type transport system permease protein n=1 Tax=Actinomycetospora corticicola TaxID=663602 RepID=A0A7Y9J4J9_9PSEU|nr:hypothetical protein [Actinomycetospora corticicola]NYD35153.1 hypothetical protein [Actinomycetospora corticicola]
MTTTDLRRIRALVVLRLAEVLAAQRPLVPAVLFVVLVLVLTVNDPSSAPGPWPVTVPVLSAASTWLTLAATNTGEDRTVATAAAGGPGRWAVAAIGAALLLELPPVVVGALLPALLHPAGYPPAVIGGAVVAHLTAAMAGTAIGLGCSRPVVDRPGLAAALAFVVVVVAATVPWLPPVGTAVRAVGEGTPSVADPVVAAALLGVVSVGWWARSRRG